MIYFKVVKGMSVAYNFLNLPKQMLWSDAGTGAEKIIDILYDAKGRKLRKTVTDNTTLLYRQDYAGNLEYRFTTANGLQPEAAYFGDGRVAFIENSRRYEYYLKDHLGNIRLTFTDKNNNGVVDVNNTATNEILQENHYYPFGMDQSGPWMNDVALDNAYKYNGIERNTDFGMNLDLAFFRSYDASLARWFQVDPKPTMASSSYVGMANNPFVFSDFMGDTVIFANYNVRKLVEKFSQNEKSVKSGKKAKENKFYNAEFAKIISDLNDKKEIFNFTSDPKLLSSPLILGEITATATGLNIIVPDWSGTPKASAQEENGGLSYALFEEVFHAKQYLEGDLVKFSDNNGFGLKTKTGLGLGMIEANAKIWAADRVGIETYKKIIGNDTYDIYTWAGLIRSTNGEANRPVVVANMLINGVTKSYNSGQIGGNPREVTYKTPYSKF